MSISKKDISKVITKETRLSNFQSKKFLDFFIHIVKINSDSKFVKIHNFGVFLSKYTTKRTGRNPATSEIYPIKSFKKITFKASSKVKSIIN